MDQSQKRISAFAVAAIIVLFVLFVACRLALREPSPSPQQEPPGTESAKSLPRQTSLDFAAIDNQPAEPPVGQLENSTVTNAAVLYRQAFALYNTLSKDEKGLLVDWRTNVDASIDAELCEKMRPICDIMHRATAVTNCDWGIEPLMYDTKLPHLSPARGISRAAIWNAAHCQGDDLPGAADDVLSALRLGRSVSHTAVVGSLVDMAIQAVAESYVAANVGLFRGSETQRLTSILTDPAYEAEPSLAMEQEAIIHDRFVAKLASMPADEFEKSISQMLDGGDAPKMDRAVALAKYKQVTDSEHDLAKALASGSADEYEAWLQQRSELEQSNPLAKELLSSWDKFVDRVERAAVSRAMVVAALEVAEAGPSALQSHPDPSTGQPFVYTETTDGFELQSSFQTNGVPLKMQFK